MTNDVAGVHSYRRWHLKTSSLEVLILKSLSRRFDGRDLGKKPEEERYAHVHKLHMCYDHFIVGDLIRRQSRKRRGIKGELLQDLATERVSWRNLGIPNAKLQSRTQDTEFLDRVACVWSTFQIRV